MASTLTTEFAHLQIPLEDVAKATNNFSDKNIIGKGGFGNVYKGKLKNPSGESIKIVARRLDYRHGQGDIEFWTEVSVLSSLKHENIVSMIGFCDENGEKVIIHHHYRKGSLNLHLRNTNVTPLQRIKISRGIADAIAYLHDLPGESYHVIHRNINSFTILLDDNWEPKLSGFEFCVKHAKDRKNEVYICETIGTKGYIDPEIHETGGVTHKSDIYSMAVVFSEILFGRKVYFSNNHDNKSPRQKGTLKDVIAQDLWYQDSDGAYLSNILTRHVIFCGFKDRKGRDDADYVSSELSQAIKDLNIESGESSNSIANHAHTSATSVTPSQENLSKYSYALACYEHSIATSFTPTKVKRVEDLRIELEAIKLAISDFSKSLTYTSDSYSLFESELECVDKEYLFDLNTKNKDYLPTRRYNVLIKQIHIEEYKLDTEIEILGSCMHRNIQSFLGFCDEGPGMIHVFEFILNYDLDTELDDPNFTWEERLKVCIDIAHGLYYLRHGMKDQKMVIHRDIKSKNIGLVVAGKDIGMAYITGFQHAILLPRDQHYDTLQLKDNRPMTFYTDPEYANSGMLKAESDVFSFGVVLFEILCGMTVDKILSKESRQDTRLEQVVGRWFQKGIIKNKVAISLKQEKSENAYFPYNGLNKDSLDTFIAIAYRCLAELQNQRPTIEVIVEELEKSLSFQKNHKVGILKMSFEDIRKATNNFSHVIGEGGFGSVYVGEVAQKHSYGHYAIVAKKLDTSHDQGHPQFYNELQILYKYKHENVIGLVGYSDETHEKLVCERAPKGSLDRYLSDVELPWRKRLMICIDIASGLDFLHGGVEGQEVVIHRDIKTPNILLFDDWKAKLGDFGLSLISNIDEDTDYTINRACGTPGYVDPVYLETGFLTLESDIYSFGVILFEILCGKATYKISNLKGRSLLSFIRHNFEEGKKDEIVFGAIKEEIIPKSLTTYINTMYKCLDNDRGKRPTIKEVRAQLNKALELQDEEEDIKPNLPEDKEKLELSETTDV